MSAAEGKREMPRAGRKSTVPREPRVDPEARDRDFVRLPPINGYAETFSIFAGEVAAIRVARKPAAPHAGDKPAFVRRIQIKNAVTGKVVTVRKPEAAIRIFEQMPKNYRDEGAGYDCRIPLDTTGWPPAVYECVIFDDAGNKSRDIYLNVKPRSFDGCDIVCVLPAFTWQAYSHVGGASFYPEKKGQESTVSLCRPIVRKADNFIESALPFLALFESKRIAYACIDSLDLHRRLCPLKGVPVVALLTHDEYWSDAMRAEIDRYLAQRGVMLVMAGNVCWWRIQVGGNNISVDKRRGHGLWHLEGAPEENSFGASFRFGGYPVELAAENPKLAPLVAHLSGPAIRESRGIQVTEPDHPIFRGIELTRNGSFGGDVPIMYREIDGVPLNDDGTVDRNRYKADNVAPHILATGLAVSGRGRASVQKVGVVVEAGVNGGHVLHLGTFGWSLALRTKNKAATKVIANAYRYCRRLARRHSRV
jgi:hypothetical protein